MERAVDGHSERDGRTKERKACLVALFSFCVCPAGRGNQHAEAGFVVQREAARRPQTETGHHSSE